MNKIDYLNLEIPAFRKIKTYKDNKIDCHFEIGQHLLHSEENTEKNLILNSIVDLLITLANNIKTSLDNNNRGLHEIISYLKEIKIKSINKNIDNIRASLGILNAEIKKFGVILIKTKEIPSETKTLISLNQEVNRIKITQKQLEEVLADIRKIVSS